MSFLQRTTEAPRYEKLGYRRNPFPKGAEVRPEVHVDRVETDKLQKQLSAFVFQSGKGGFWALEGRRGVGKSNLLRHIEWDLSNESSPPTIVARYLGSQLVSPRLLAAEMVLAISESRMANWLLSTPALPENLRHTDLDRWLRRAKLRVKEAPDDGGRKKTARTAVGVLARWLSCQQTYVDERKEYDIQTRERLSPAQAFPYLRAIVDGIAASGGLTGIVLLIDELEDLVAMPGTEATQYAQALKALINTFNMERLFVIMAGQEGSVQRLGLRNTSLAARWETVELKPLANEREAVDLANAYKESVPKVKGFAKEPAPSDVIVRKRFDELYKQGLGVVHRDLLGALHDWVEEHAET